jgi:hypothetical protein
MHVIMDIYALATVAVEVLFIVKFQERSYGGFCINPACILNKVPLTHTHTQDTFMTLKHY